MKVTDRRSPLFIRHSGNFDLGLTIGEREKNAAYRILFLKEIRRPGDVWQLVGVAHESFQIFFFFFALIFQTAGSQEVLALRFCIIMCNTVKQNKTGTKKCTFIMKRHTVQICGQAFGTGGGYLINMSN